MSQPPKTPPREPRDAPAGDDWIDRLRDRLVDVLGALFPEPPPVAVPVPVRRR